MSGPKTDFIPGKPGLAIDHMGSGPLVLFLHGIGGHRTNWRDQLPALAGEFRAAAWDARGYGDSDDYEGPLRFGDFADDVLRVLDHFGAEKAHFCGLSMGGRILQDLHARYPERVATLVLCDTTPGFDVSMTPEQKAEFVRLRAQPLRDGKGPRDMAAGVIKTLVGPNAPREAFERMVDSMALLHKESYIKTVEASLDFNRAAELADISVPTLLIFGEHDTLTPPEVGRRMQEAIPHAELVVVEDAGHLVNIEQPDVFNATIRAFLLKHRDRAC